MTCSSLHLKTIAAIFFVVGNVMNQASAQTVAPSTDVKILPASAQSLESAIPYQEPGHKLILVTSKDPTVKRTCRLDSVTADEIRCKQRFHKQPVIYSRTDLDTIIEPGGAEFYWQNFIVFVALGGGIITGACFLGAVSALAIIGAVPIAIIGALFVLIAPAMSEAEAVPPSVVYQKPGTTLAVKLY